MKKVIDTNVCEFCFFCKIKDVFDKDFRRTYKIYNCDNGASCIFGARVISSFSCKFFRIRGIK